MKTEIYLELYVYDYLKKEETTELEIELWGRQYNQIFYIETLYEMTSYFGDLATGRQALRKQGLEYMGRFVALYFEDDRYRLIFEQGNLLYTREVTIYASDETSVMQEFLLQKEEAQMLYASETNEEKVSGAAKVTAAAKGTATPSAKPSLKWKELWNASYKKRIDYFFQMLSTIFLILLTVNLIVTINYYEGMQEMLRVLALTLLFE